MPLSLWSLTLLLLKVAPSLVPLPDSLPTQARSADAFVNSIGVNVHLSYFQSPYGKSWDDIVKPKLLASGIRHIRDGATVLPDDRWMQIVYGRMNELAARGVHADLVIRLADPNVQATLDGWDRPRSRRRSETRAAPGLSGSATGPTRGCPRSRPPRGTHP